MSTFAQLAQLHGVEVPRATVLDWPDYPVRGFILDVGRRFVSMDTVRGLVADLARFKINTLVMHLNDNEIASDTGRPWADAQHGFRLRSDNPVFAVFASKDGAYTRHEWDALEAFAAERGVRVVAEIDGPAHVRAFIVHRPELGRNGGDSDMLDLSTPAATEFMKALLNEFAPWFRGPWLHFGADEYDHDEAADYRRYFNEIAAHVRSLGKTPMAWGSLTTMAQGAGPLPPEGYDRDLIMCSWNKGWYGLEAAIEDGYPVINTNDTWLYTVPYADYYCGDGLRLPELWAHWEPHIAAEGDKVQPFHPSLLGAMSACWNDLVLRDYTERDMLDMVVPTFPLLGQKMWGGTPQGVSFEEFTRRAEALN